MPRPESAALFSLALLAALSAAQAAPPSPAPSGAKAPACKQDDPANVTMAQSETMPGNSNVTGNLISLKGCAAKGGHIICSLALTKKTPGLQNIAYKLSDYLRDGDKERHAQLSGTFYNGHCKKIASVDLDKDEWVWITQEFDGPTDGVTDAKLIFSNGLVLSAPVEAAQ